MKTTLSNISEIKVRRDTSRKEGSTTEPILEDLNDDTIN